MEIRHTTKLERFIGWVGKTFFEQSGYKSDLHEDLSQLILEIKNLSTMVYTLIAEYKNVITIYKLGSPDNNKRRMK